MIDPADVHYYQPGWTLVGAGVFWKAMLRGTEWLARPEKITAERE